MPVPIVFVKTFKDLILLWKIAAAAVFVVNDDNYICRKVKIIFCKKIFKSFQTSSLFLRVFWFCFLTFIRTLVVV